MKAELSNSNVEYLMSLQDAALSKQYPITKCSKHWVKGSRLLIAAICTLLRI